MFLKPKSAFPIMGRKKFVDHFRDEESEHANPSTFSPQERFQNYLESRVTMVYNYVMKRWGAKPRGYLNAVELSYAQTSWGKHYILNIVFPRNLTNYDDQLKGFLHFVLGVFPTPDMVSVKIVDANQFGQESDFVTIEARLVMVAIIQ